MPTSLPSPDIKDSYVQQMFNRIAPTYDLLNDCISFGMHRAWKAKACQKLRLQPGAHVLDVCTGTGDLTPRLAQHVGPSGHVIGLDFSEEMLDIGRKRFAHLPHIAFQQGDAMEMPFATNTFDGAIVSFGLRNVIDIQRVLNEMSRVVKPGGWVVNLDTCPNPKLPGYWFYFSHIMPRLGKLLSMDPTAYQYLSESTKNFLAPDALHRCFENAGLVNVSVTPIAFGSVSLQAGQKG